MLEKYEDQQLPGVPTRHYVKMGACGGSAPEVLELSTLPSW